MMKPLRHSLLWLLGWATLCACAPTATLKPLEFQQPPVQQLADLPLRPEYSPDVLIFSISGRCGPPCQAPQDSWDYIGERGALNKLVAMFEQHGLKVQVESYAERITTNFTSRRSKLPQRGILDLLTDYQTLTDAWVLNKRNPAKVIVLGHSHGAVWAHYLTTVFDKVPVAALVDLDANCAAWNADHSPEMVAAQTALWSDDKVMSPLLACDSMLLSARKVRLKDVVWPNVELNFEVQSKRWPAQTRNSLGLYVNYLFELTPNQRPDGSKNGITTFVSLHEDHSAVAYPKSQALDWVTQQLSKVEWLPSLPVVVPPVQP